jgi:hypothetical protein
MMPSLAAAPAEFEQRVHKALKSWGDAHPKEGLLDDLLIAQRTAQTQAAETQVLTQRQRTNLLLEGGITYLADMNPHDAELLRLRFCRGLPVDEARRQFNYAESTIYAKQNQAIGRLAAILYGQEMTAWHERAAQLAGRLDTPHVRAIGIDRQVEYLAGLLREPDGPWVLSIEGIGGIGKTTLAAAVARRLAADTAFEEFGWVSAQLSGLDLCGQQQTRPRPTVTVDALLATLAVQLLPPGEVSPGVAFEEQLTALRRRLAQAPHLIIVDNFETLLDAGALLPALHTLANPTKFLITSRRRLISEPNVHLHAVPELSAEHGLALLRQAAQEHELGALAQCRDEDLLAIYAAVGGNPLALLLVVGQTHVRPLHDVLVDLAQARTQALQTLFDYIYRQAWDSLGELDRRVLLVVAATQVTDLDAGTLGVVCGLPLEQVTAALQRLIQANLVYVQGDLDTCCYRVHSLTYRFLQGFVGGWMGKSAM